MMFDLAEIDKELFRHLLEDKTSHYPRWMEVCLDEYQHYGWNVEHIRWGDDDRPSVLVLRNDTFVTHAEGPDWWRERDANYEVVLRFR